MKVAEKTGHRCLPLRTSHLLRFNLVAGPKKKHRTGGKSAEADTQGVLFIWSLPIRVKSLGERRT
jgi:hypothetical protein